MSRPSERSVMPLVAVLLASFGAHLLLWSLGDEVLGMAWQHRRLPKTENVMEVALLDEDEEQPEPPEEEDPTLAPGKLVQLDHPNDRAPEHDTPYVSEFDNRTSHPTRAPNTRPHPGAPGQPGTHKDGNEGKQDSADPLKPHAIPLIPSRDADDQGDDSSDPDDDGELPRPGGVPLPRAVGSTGSRKALQDALGQPGSFDDIDKSVEEGPVNDTEAKRWEFASFFNRVRNGVAEHWHPETLHAANDPDGTKYGTKTRKTRLLIQLNADGSLHRIKLDGSCDIGYLDEEAIRAVRTAAPFVNPPPGLVDKRTGLIEFGFGFIFEFRGENRIFRYRR